MATQRQSSLLLFGAALICAVFAPVERPRTGAILAKAALPAPTDNPLHRAANSRTGSLPDVVFWAWERPEDLRFLRSQKAGVAFLAKTIYLPSSPRTSTDAAANFIVRARLQPLRVAPGTPLIAVVRIENSPSTSAALGITAVHRDALGSEIAALQNLPSVRAVQIDFDATTSQHAFYTALLLDVRRKLPSSMPLSITALASWCIGDSWLMQLPPGTVDEAVPMLFRLGADAATVTQFLRSGAEFRTPACRASLGLSTDEPLSHELLSKQWPGVPASGYDKRIYVFAPRAWTQPVADSVLQEWQP